MAARPSFAAPLACAALLLTCGWLPAAQASKQAVTYGSAVKLASAAHNFLLHSHQITYGSGSGQQSVTGTPSDGTADGSDMWMVKPVEGAGAVASGTPLRHGDKFRLMHAATRTWLHSHRFQSPLSGQQEVSAHGGDEASDENDEWMLVLDSKAQWSQDAKVRVQHVKTKAYLSMTNRRFGRPISGQLEVAGLRAHSTDSTWKATEGVYVPLAESGDRDEL